MEYLHKLRQALPENLTTFYNNTVGGLFVFEQMNQKFERERLEIESAENFDIDDPQMYSCNFEGNLERETQKRKSQLVKKRCFEEVKKFMEQINFESLMDAKLIVESFYNRHLKLLIIELDEIAEKMDTYFHNKVNYEDMQLYLSQGMEDLSLLILEYFQGQYSKDLIHEEFIVSFAELQDFTYEQIRDRAYLVQYQTYLTLITKLNGYVEQKINDKELQELCKQICEKKVIYKELKQQIEQLCQQKLKQFNEEVDLLYSFPVTNVIRITHLRKLRDYFLRKIMSSLSDFSILGNKEQYDLHLKIENLFLKYLQDKVHTDGIKNPEINQQLQYLIYQIDWIQACNVANEAKYLIQQLSSDFGNVQQMTSQIKLKQEQFALDNLSNFKRYNKNRCQEAEEYWDKKINEDLNLLVIFQIYTILAQIVFIDNKFLLIGTYEPSCRLALLFILRKLNNGKYKYLNITVLQICEQITHSIQKQIHEDIKKKIFLIEEKKVEEDILNQYVPIRLQDVIIKLEIIQSPEKGLKKLYEINQFFFNLLTPISQGGIVNCGLQIKQQQELNVRLTQIKKLQKFPEEEIPIINFEVLQNEEYNSNIITLFIPGFLSGSENKYEAWGQFLQPGAGTVIALHWSCKGLIDFCRMLINTAGPQIFRLNAFQLIHDIIDVLPSNPYESAHQEAVKVGRYLAYLIAVQKLFGDRQINIVVHSLGSMILLQCIKELDIIYEQNKKQHINEIIIMGGVADVRKLQKRRWNSVAGRIYNVFSENDMILKIILRITKQQDLPCGRRKVYLGYKSVTNRDFTELVEGHCDYKVKLGKIIAWLDFNNDFKWLIEQFKEIY